MPDGCSWAVANLPIQRAVDPTTAREAWDRTMIAKMPKQRKTKLPPRYPLVGNRFFAAVRGTAQRQYTGTRSRDPLVALRTVACADRWTVCC